MDRQDVKSNGDFANSSSWYAVKIRQSSERIAVANLERQGFRSFLPVHLKTVRHARQFRTVRAPLFPGYLFVFLDLARDRWRAVNGTYGVTSLVMGANQPAPVPRGIVEALMALAVEKGGTRLNPALSPGQRVKLLAGPFADFIGTLERIDGQGRVRILLEMMGTYVPVGSTSDQVIAA